MNENLIIKNENIKLNQINYICSLCNKKSSYQIKCISCNNSYCHTCFEDFNKNRINSSCPFGCRNPSFKIIYNIEKYNNNSIELLSTKKINFLKYINILKRYKEIDNKINKIDYKGINTTHLSYNFNSFYHPHCLYNMVLNSEGWICDICEKTFEVKSNGRYRCHKCDFDICVNCRIIEEKGYKFDNIFVSRYHKHLLKEKTLRENDWICDACDIGYQMKTIKRYRCERCDFDICYNCKIKEIINTNGYFFNFLIAIIYICFIHGFYDSISQYIKI